MAKTKRRPTPAEWAATLPRPRSGKPCWICSREEARAATDEFRALGEDQPTLKQIGDYLREFFGFPLNDQAIGRHYRDHTGRAS